MAAPREVIDLVERFDRNRESYRSSGYNETETRREFIDPFFKALGWDIDNEQGYAEAYKDVVHEDAIKIGGVTKAPDYACHVWEISLLPVVPVPGNHVLWKGRNTHVDRS